MQATNINGTAIIKEYSAAALRVRPIRRPPPMVEPEREKPGHKERIWNAPTSTACLIDILSTSSSKYSCIFSVFFSAYIIKKAPRTKPIATVNGENKYCLMALCAKKAMPITGTIPAATCQTLRPLLTCQPSCVKKCLNLSL
ncbi:hypothetical protein SDC9_71288 [bioreactor metagenome]|uniref:Uncharacterized protein n=1 Tax=bioreactor metagenome TaxID=1076179 RepID=A0A644YE45_9ZZZZ